MENIETVREYGDKLTKLSEKLVLKEGTTEETCQNKCIEETYSEEMIKPLLREATHKFISGEHGNGFVTVKLNRGTKDFTRLFSAPQKLNNAFAKKFCIVIIPNYELGTTTIESFDLVWNYKAYSWTKPKESFEQAFLHDIAVDAVAKDNQKSKKQDPTRRIQNMQAQVLKTLYESLDEETQYPEHPMNGVVRIRFFAEIGVGYGLIKKLIETGCFESFAREYNMYVLPTTDTKPAYYEVIWNYKEYANSKKAKVQKL